jgi:hypothetical protein
MSGIALASPFASAYPEWKMDKESNGPPEEKKDYSEMSGRELLLKIMELAASRDRTDDELSRILGAIERVLSKSKGPDKK